MSEDEQQENLIALIDGILDRRPILLAHQMLERVIQHDARERNALRKIAQRPDGADAVQEIRDTALTDLLENALTFYSSRRAAISPLLGESQFTLWITSAYEVTKRALNTARIRYARDRKRLKDRSVGSLLLDLLAARNDPLREVESMQAFDRLTAEEIEIGALLNGDGLSIEEVSKRTGVTEYRVKRIRDRLAAMLAELSPRAHVDLLPNSDFFDGCDDGAAGELGSTDT